MSTVQRSTCSGAPMPASASTAASRSRATWASSNDSADGSKPGVVRRKSSWNRAGSSTQKSKNSDADVRSSSTGDADGESAVRKRSSISAQPSANIASKTAFGVGGGAAHLELRRAFFSRSRCISLRHEVLAAAAACPDVDVEHVAAALDTGRYRAAVMADYAAARAGAAPCSGTVVHPDGTGICNPGTRTDWIGGAVPHGTPVLLGHDPAAYD